MPCSKRSPPLNPGIASVRVSVVVLQVRFRPRGRCRISIRSPAQEDAMGLPSPRGGVKLFVSPRGPGVAPEDGAGTFTDPFHSIATGIEKAAGGGTVYLRAGDYEESVAVRGVSGTWLKKIVVRPYKSEQVTIDALIPE